MERCPNCGAPARPGAKFCTTCGYRLPVAPPVTQPAAGPSDAPSTSATSSWPPPPAPAEATTTEQPQSPASAETSTSGTDEVVVVPIRTDDTADTALTPEIESDAVAETVESTETTASIDSVLSSSWPSPNPSNQPSPWATSDSAAGADETVVATETETDEIVVSDGEDDIEAESAVTEETIVVAEPASQYEGWSSAVVEEIAAPAAAHGTNVARATALLDELRLLLPVLNSGGGGNSDAVASDLEAALAAADEGGSERQALRSALNDARDNPRDIQTVLAISQQADAAIALLDDHDRLVAAVKQAIAALKPARPGLYPDES